MGTTRVSSKGQVIIPKMIREARRWAAGTELEVRDTPEGVLLKRFATDAKTPLKPGLAAIRARIGHRGAGKTIEEMDAAILREAVRRAGRAGLPGVRLLKS